MSVWSVSPATTPLATSEGELVLISVSVEPRHLESLLEALGHVPFPVNPEIQHGAHACDQTGVSFPAFSGSLGEVRKVLGKWGFAADSLRVASMLEEIQRP